MTPVPSMPAVHSSSPPAPVHRALDDDRRAVRAVELAGDVGGLEPGDEVGVDRQALVRADRVVAGHGRAGADGTAQEAGVDFLAAWSLGFCIR